MRSNVRQKISAAVRQELYDSNRFSPAVLSRARRRLDRSEVRQVKGQMEGTWVFRVQGTERKHLVNVLMWGLLYTTCSCAGGMKKGANANCNHAAAALMAIEKMTKK